MGYKKWIGGALGWFLTGGSPLGALAGFALGSMFDEDNSDGSSSSGSNFFSGFNQQGGFDPLHQGERNSFIFSLLVMASYVIKADGKVMHSEMELVRQFLRVNFGEQAVPQGEQIIKKLFEEQKRLNNFNPNAFRQKIFDCGRQIAQNMPYEQRVQLLAFLVQIAKADGSVPQSEIDALRDVAAAMSMRPEEIDSMMSMGGTTLEDAYKTLGIDPSATDDEVRRAYRRMALKHHPDKVETLGEDMKRAAEKKFQEINAAKEQVFKARGMS